MEVIHPRCAGIDVPKGTPRCACELRAAAAKPRRLR
jgi:hypothetical protein